MRLSLVLLSICVHVCVFAHSQHITLSVKDVKLSKVLKALQKQSKYSFLYDVQALERAPLVSLDVRDRPLVEVLNASLQKSNLKYVLQGSTYVISEKAPAKRTAITQRTIKGLVTNSSMEPLSGVTVRIVGSDQATRTDDSGLFEISVPRADSKLLLEMIGFQSLELVVGSESYLELVLESSISDLDEVVITGYGTSSRKKLTSAVASVKPEDLNRTVTGDVGQLLQGKVPGLNISASGNPNQPAAIVLRGASTINSPQGPFYVIDGIPGADITAIAPDDIASIDVLKDAAATAIYGNRASNGVIMVTTKRGQSGVSQATYSNYLGIEEVSGSLDLMDADELRAFLAKMRDHFLRTMILVKIPIG